MKQEEMGRNRRQKGKNQEETERNRMKREETERSEKKREETGS